MTNELTVGEKMYQVKQLQQESYEEKWGRHGSDTFRRLGHPYLWPTCRSEGPACLWGVQNLKNLIIHPVFSQY